MKRWNRKRLYVLFVIFSFVTMAYGQSASYEQTTVSNSCWSNNAVIATSTQQNSLAIFENYVYMVYYNADRYMCISRNNNYGSSNTPWVTVQLPHRYEQRNGSYDNHNTPNIAISPTDKRIHLAFDMHARDLRYMISVENLAVAPDEDFKASAFSGVKSSIEENGTVITQVTYPRFVLAEDSTLYFLYRGEGGSGNANSFIAKYKDNGYWEKPIKFINGKIGTYEGDNNRCAYFNDIQIRNGVLYFTWMWRENSNGITSNHDLMFAYTEDGGTTWKNNENQTVPGPMHLNSPGITAVKIPTGSDMINHNACAVDGSGNVHVVVRIAGKYRHYYRVGTTWYNRTIPTSNVGDRPKLYADRKTNTLYLVYRIGSSVNLYGTYPNNNQWNQWKLLKSINSSFSSSTNSFINATGDTLSTMAVSSDNRLKFIQWKLTSTSEVVGLDDKLIDKSISVYPNPSNGRFNVKLGNDRFESLTLFSLNGQVVYEFKNPDNLCTLDLPLEAGAYILKAIGNDGKSLHAKLIIR